MSFLRPFFTLLSLLILALAAYLLWSWYQGDPVLFPDGVVVYVRQDWQLGSAWLCLAGLAWEGRSSSGCLHVRIVIRRVRSGAAVSIFPVRKVPRCMLKLSRPERFCSSFPEQKCSTDTSKKASDIGGLFAWSSLFPDDRVRWWRGIFG